MGRGVDTLGVSHYRMRASGSCPGPGGDTLFERELSMDANTAATRGLYGQRPSKSADAARRREFERIAAMTPRERVLLALSLKERARLMSASARPLAGTVERP